MVVMLEEVKHIKTPEEDVLEKKGILMWRCCVSQSINLISQHNPKLEGCSGALGRSFCQDGGGRVSSLSTDG